VRVAGVVCREWCVPLLPLLVNGPLFQRLDFFFFFFFSFFSRCAVLVSSSPSDLLTHGFLIGTKQSQQTTQRARRDESI